MSEFDTYVGPAELPQDLVGVFGVYNYAISLTGLLKGHRWEDGETGEYSYKVKSGARGRPTRQELTIRVTKHEKGDNGSAVVEITHTVVPYKKYPGPKAPGHLNGRVYEFGPNDTLTGLPGGKKLIHGKHIRLNPARDITPHK
jgi:hypothetical protein